MANTRKSKKDRGPQVGHLRGVLAENVAALCELRWPNENSMTARHKQLAAAMGAHLPQVQRIVGGKSGVSIDEVERLARALMVPPHDLITPYRFRTTMVDLMESQLPKPAASAAIHESLPRYSTSSSTTRDRSG
jgi:hypothetical protein